MKMGTTNGVSRGQLRPYLTGRTPPFLLVGLLVVLGIFGFSYWSLNTQFNDLQVELQKLQDRLRIYAETREAAEKQNSALQAQLQTSQDSDGKCKIVSEKKQQELNQLADQLKFYENEVKKATAIVEAKKIDLEKCESVNLQKDSDMESLSEKIKVLESEKSQLREKNEQLLINTKATKPVHENESINSIQIAQPVESDKKTVEEPSAAKNKEKNIEILDSDKGTNKIDKTSENLNPDNGEIKNINSSIKSSDILPKDINNEILDLSGVSPGINTKIKTSEILDPDVGLPPDESENRDARDLRITDKLESLNNGQVESSKTNKTIIKEEPQSVKNDSVAKEVQNS